MKNLFFLLILTVSFSSFGGARFDAPFFFGVANAPGQVEDQLNDIWLDYGRAGKIAAWNNHLFPEDRLRFWTAPEVEIDLAARTGITVYRMGVDWERLMPAPHTFDEAAFKRYHEIIDMVRARGMQVMLTIMHHSIPSWAQDQGGWLTPKMQDHFAAFGQRVVTEFQGKVEYWLTFNEANIFAMHAYTDGLWPPMKKASLLSLLAIGPLRGRTVKAMDRMMTSHNRLYRWAHAKYPNIKMGIAHNMGYYSGKRFIDRITAKISGDLMNWRIPSKIRGHMDFFGFNYYGAEWFRGKQIDIDPSEEYSEAGRAVHPEGFYWVIKQVHRRFPKLPIIVTENGMADETDILRPSYLIEHLMVIDRARKEGIPVMGYIAWTLTDNLEWQDGYCPKFGMVGVDRATFERKPRPSYYLFQKIASTREITDAMRAEAWKLVTDNVGKERPMCRADDGITALDVPVPRKIVPYDWRFRP